MLGHYENFPEEAHKTIRFTTSISNKRLQQALTQIFHTLNDNKNFRLEEVSNPSVPQCELIFEFGIAEGTSFNYIDEEEAKTTLKAIRKKPFPVMDFFCAIRYYKTQNERRAPLKFDYYMLRFLFKKDLIEMQAFHERGPRHVSPEDIVGFIVGKVNETFPRKGLKPFGFS